MEIKIFQKGFNFSQDGPGNRLVYHLSGCNLKCPWCSNPEGLSPGEGSTVIPLEDIVNEASSCRMMFFDGGGITLTGGEATCQKDSVYQLIKMLKESGINTCIETNASLTGCENIFREVDYMIADFKSPNKELLKEITGADLEAIKKNLIFRAGLKKPLLVRIPLINGFNTGKENALAFANFFEELAAVSGKDSIFFEILTYHEFGKEKYSKLGLKYSIENGFVSPEAEKLLADELRKRNLNVINT